MELSRHTLKQISHSSAHIPDEAVFNLPEKVLQFGTGVLLRGLPDYFIDKANRQGLFNGRIVVVKSTAHGDTAAFDQQDGLYTVCVRGIENGQKVESNVINASISRVLSAHDHWGDILQCAHNPQLQLIISNTTEVGIQLVNEAIDQAPPLSFPGKLLAFLYERYKAFNGSADSGLVVIPTELIPDNGKKLQSIVLELARFNNLDEAFIIWLTGHNHFCSSLVDRIVPGKPDAEPLAILEKELGYKDDLLIMAEAYRLWAIEGGEPVKKVLTFAPADEGVIIEPSIDRHRELKLRLLNGTHTLSCGLAFLAGCGTVKEAMDDAEVSSFIQDLMLNELAPSIPYPMEKSVVQDFGKKVLDRFRNPYIRHQWINITLQYTSKMKMRNIPVLLQHYTQHSYAPQLFTLGFAAYLRFLKPVAVEDKKYYGEYSGQRYPIQDDRAEWFYHQWKDAADEAVVKEVLRSVDLWGKDLTTLPGFYEAVWQQFNHIETKGVRGALELIYVNKEVV